jgi:hypothetical protein
MGVIKTVLHCRSLLSGIWPAGFKIGRASVDAMILARVATQLATHMA